jgi:hypothetical protein
MWYITRRYLRLAALAWGPVWAMMIVMFVASAQPKFGPPTAEPAAIYFSGALPIFPGIWDLLIKKSAHMIAFGLLALLNMRALLAWNSSLKGAAYLAIVLAVGYAMLDEFHQAFVPGRSASGLDVGLDFVGAALFTLLARRYYASRLRKPLDQRYAAIQEENPG